MSVSGWTVLVFLTFVNLINYVDRFIVSGAPIQFGDFVAETLHVPERDQAFYLLAITPAFIATFSVSSIAVGHLTHYMSPFRLLSVSSCMWCVALALSGFSYWLPRSPSAYWCFIGARALSGVGEAAFQCIVPAYIEDFAPPESRALWLATLYASIPVGSAIGFGYGAAVAPIGWGWAYLIEVAIMLPCAISFAWLPSAATLRRRRTLALRAQLHAPLCGTVNNSGATFEASPISSNDSGTLAAAGGAYLTPPAGTHAAHGLAPPDESPPTLVATEAPPSITQQLAYLILSPTYMLIAFGYAAFTATVVGLSQACPLALLGLRFFTSEFYSSTIFGAVTALAGVLGTPLGGYATDLAVRRWAHPSSSSTTPTPEGRTPEGRTSSTWKASLSEARALLRVITLMIALAAVLTIAAVLCLFAGPSYAPLFFVTLCLAVTFSFATSAGITRAIMLVVPLHVRSFALGLCTLLLHALGDVPSPLILSRLIGLWAPSCVSIVHLNGTSVLPSSATGGTPGINPDCYANVPAGQTYSTQQTGLLYALLAGAFYMLTAVVYWGLAGVVLSRRMATEVVCPPVRPPKLLRATE